MHTIRHWPLCTTRKSTLSLTWHPAMKRDIEEDKPDENHFNQEIWLSLIYTVWQGDIMWSGSINLSGVTAWYKKLFIPALPAAQSIVHYTVSNVWCHFYSICAVLKKSTISSSVVLINPAHDVSLDIRHQHQHSCHVGTKKVLKTLISHKPGCIDNCSCAKRRVCQYCEHENTLDQLHSI